MTLTTVAAGAQASKESIHHTVAAAHRGRPLVTASDIAFLIYYYPLRWLVALLGVALLRWMRFSVESAIALLPARCLRDIQHNLTVMLGLKPEEALPLARRCVSNQVRAALFDLQADAGGFRPPKVEIQGREHLDLARADGAGVILLALHTRAKREARLGLQPAGIELCPVIFGEDRRFTNHGRMLWRLVRARLLALQFKTLSRYIVLNGRDAPFEIVRALRDGGCVLMSPDVAVSSSVERHPFMNTSFPVSIGALEVARLTGCPVIPMWVWCSGQACCVEFRPALPLRFAGGEEETRKQNLKLLLGAMEEQLRAHPEQWEFWNCRMTTL